MEPVLLLSFGDEKLTFAHITVQEMLKVKTWTGLKSRRELFAAIIDEDPEALVAAFCLARKRDGEEIRFSDADFDLDRLNVTLVDENGREVEPHVKKDNDGAPVLDEKGQPIPILSKSGAQQWLYVDSGDLVPPTETASTPT